MAGDEPSEDAEAGADADQPADGDPGENSTSREPVPEETAADGPADGSRDYSRTDEPADDDREPAEDGDESAATETDDPTDGAVEAEAEALVEEMEAAVEDAEAAEGPDDADAGAGDGGDRGGDGDGDGDRGEADGEGDASGVEPPAESPDVEAPPLGPDQEMDPDVDLPDPEGELPDTPTAADAGFETPPEADVETPGVEATSAEAGAPPDHAGPVEEVGAAETAGEAEEPGGLLGGPGSGPAEDREMPLADHIREMLQRLAVVIAVAGFVSLLAFPFAEDIINFLWYSILPGVESDIARPRLYGVLELVFTELKVASLAGLIVALPVMVYETYAFMRPGLYPNERRYYLAAIPTSLVLALVGVAFAYFVVLPAIFVYFLYYSQDVATIGFALGRTFDLILLMMGYLAVVFQIPLFIMLAMMMGLVTRRWLAERRLLFWGAFLGLSFFFGFDPTGMAPIIVAATMIALFEGTLLLTKWTGRE